MILIKQYSVSLINNGYMTVIGQFRNLIGANTVIFSSVKNTVIELWGFLKQEMEWLLDVK